MTMTEERLAPPPLEEEEATIVTEWKPVGEWGVQAHEILEDIEQIMRVISRMRGGPATERVYTKAMEILDVALRGRRMELAALILEMHSGSDTPG
jgi:hypothetical protein